MCGDPWKGNDCARCMRMFRWAVENVHTGDWLTHAVFMGLCANLRVDRCSVPVERIADTCRATVPVVARALERLEARGIITTRKAHSGATVYTVPGARFARGRL